MSALTTWEEIYTSYSPDELAQEVTNLKKINAGGYVAQAVGGKSYTKDTTENAQRLQAATRIQAARGSGTTGRQAFVGEVRFGGVDGQPGA